MKRCSSESPRCKTRTFTLVPEADGGSLKCTKKSYTENKQKNNMQQVLIQFLLLFLDIVFEVYLLTIACVFEK